MIPRSAIAAMKAGRPRTSTTTRPFTIMSLENNNLLEKHGRAPGICPANYLHDD